MNTPNAFALLCQTLERHLTLTATTADWLRWLTEAAAAGGGANAYSPDDVGLAAFQLLHRAFLQKEEHKTATLVFCPACYCHHEVFIWTVNKMEALRAEL